MDIQQEINRAWTLKKEGLLTEALSIYNKIFDILCNEAREYARVQDGSITDDGDVRKINPQFLKLSQVYLQRDNSACVILNNMGVILAEMGRLDEAKNMFTQSIELTPEDLDYPNPKIGLKNL